MKRRSTSSRKAIDAPHGMILVTGPTGSGKTTTLYSVLQELNNPQYNIVTVEDPIEYELDGHQSGRGAHRHRARFRFGACAPFCVRIRTS